MLFRSLCHWLTVMAPGQVVETKDLPPDLLSGTPASTEAMPAALGAAPAAPAAMPAAPVAPAPTVLAEPLGGDAWISALEREALRLLIARTPEVMTELTRKFEAAVIKTALAHTHGRRIEAAQRLGIGRNTITRKVQELGLEPDDADE